MSGLLIAAPSSGSGKTTVTLGLLRALADRGIAVAPGKAGPDYIDPAFHAAAARTPCLNFDSWAMRSELIAGNAAGHVAGGRLLLIEAMMGLFDGAADGRGSAADLAAEFGLSVILVVDAGRMSQSVAALVNGFRTFRQDVHIAGVILNRVGSERHELMLRTALSAIDTPVVGAIPSDAMLKLPERHLGLVQAHEHAGLEAFVAHAAAVVGGRCDIDFLLRASRHAGSTDVSGRDAPRAVTPRDSSRLADRSTMSLPPLGQRIAVARDIAFAFAYEHVLAGWRRQGADIRFFSPLADEAPPADADAIYLPGGYPELHAGRIASASAFKAGMHSAAEQGLRIYGECGGYMVLGEGLVDADGARHDMLGLLPLVTSYAERKRHLGYRRVVPIAGAFFDRPMTAHEFHYSTVVAEGAADRLFSVRDALDNDLGDTGLRLGNVAGSYLHLIDLAGVVR